MEILGNLGEMLPAGWVVEFWANKPNKVFNGNETICLGWNTLIGWWDIAKVGIPLNRPRLGTVVKANDGNIYVCSSPAIPNKYYKPGSFIPGRNCRNKLEAVWTCLPDEIIFLIWPMGDYTKMPVRSY